MMPDGQFIVCFSRQLSVNKKFKLSFHQQVCFNAFIRSLDIDKQDEILEQLLRA